MIHGLYVKSYLLPDKSKESKRKTEEIRVNSNDSDGSSKSPKNQHEIFKPSTFKFSRALEYRDVTKAVVAEKAVVIEVCITQKYTRKSFVIANWNIPVSVAVKKIVKEKHKLRPCISTKIPENMKVYNASELSIVHSAHRNFSSSNPSLLMRQGSNHSWAIPYNERASSESDLCRVVTEMPRMKVPSIEITVPHEEDEELEEALQQIAIMEERERSLSRSQSRLSSGSTQIDMSWSEVGSLSGASGSGVEAHLDLDTTDLEASGSDVRDQLDSEVTDLEGVAVTRTLGVKEIQVHVPCDDKGNGTSNDQCIAAVHSKKFSSKKSHSEAANRKRPSKAKKSERKSSDIGAHNQDECELGFVSRPETPTWDNYTEPLTLSMVPMDFELDLGLNIDPRAAQLPMATGLELPHIHRSVARVASQGSDTTMHYEDDHVGHESLKVKVRDTLQPEPISFGYLGQGSSGGRSTQQSERSDSEPVTVSGKGKSTKGAKVKRSRSEEVNIKVERSPEDREFAV